MWGKGKVGEGTDRTETEPGLHLLDEMRVVAVRLCALVDLAGHVEPVDRQIDLDEDRRTGAVGRCVSVDGSAGRRRGGERSEE